MYTWKDALSESLPYLIVLFLYGVGISFLSSLLERSLGFARAEYLSLVRWNAGVSLVGVLVITLLWVPQGLLTENLRVFLSPILAFVVMYLMKVVVLASFVDLGSGSSKWLIAFVHPLVFSVLPAALVLYISALGSAWKN